MPRVWPFDQRAFKLLLPALFPCPLSLAPPSPAGSRLVDEPQLFPPAHEALNLARLPLDPPSFPELTYTRECLT